MQVLAAVDPRLPLTEVARYAARVEALGFDGLQVPETIHDAFAVSLLALEHTSTLTVRTAVALAFIRSPTLVAYTAWDLAAFSGGRFELGLGSQIRQNIEGRFAMPWSDPVARMRDYLGAIDALFEAFASGTPVRFDSESYQLIRLQPYFNPGPSADVTAPPLWLGAVNPRMCELAGELTTGVVTHPTNSDPSFLRDIVRPAMRRGADTTDHGRQPLIIASPSLALGCEKAEVAAEREAKRQILAFLYSTPAYSSALERLGHPDVAARLQSLIRRDAWSELPDVLTDDLLDQVLVSATYENLPNVLQDRYDDLVDGVVFPPLGPPDHDSLLRTAVQAISERSPRAADR